MNAQFLNPRAIRERLVFEGRLELASPARFGGEQVDAATDAPLLRGADGVPFFPGTSLKGLLRSLSANPSDAVLFGDPWGSAGSGTVATRQARLLMDDGRIVVGPGGVVPTEIRDGVAIDPALGIAAELKKFDGEWLPAGTQFDLRFELWLAGDGQDNRRCDGLLGLLAALEDGRLNVGARTSRGFGSTRLAEQSAPTASPWRWRLARFDCRTPDGFWGWLGQGVPGLDADWPRPAFSEFPTATQVAAALSRPAPVLAARTEFLITLDLAVDGSLLIRGPGEEPRGAEKESDAAHLSRRRVSGQEESIVSGTSLAGVLRHRCLRIARTLLPLARAGDAETLVSEMFGAVVKRRTGAGGGARASRVRVPEPVVNGGQRLRHTRVRIDPWTGGAAESLLFTEDALFGGRVRFEIRIRDRDSGNPLLALVERALLLLAIRDLATGDLWVGGEAAAGRGRFKPSNPDGLFATVEYGQNRLLLRYASGQMNIDPGGGEREFMDALRAWVDSI